MNLREYIKQGHTTPSALAAHLGVSDHAIKKWSYGQRQPPLNVAVQIEAFSGGLVTVNDLTKEASRVNRAA